MGADVIVISAADAGWNAVEAVFLSEATSRHCWCQFHVLDNSGHRHTTRDSRRDLLRQQVENLEPPRGLIALADDEPIGWCGVEPRSRLRHVLSSQIVKNHSPYALGDSGVWAIYCILVPPRHRRSGVGRELLGGAIAHAVASGATALEGYPIDTDSRGGKLPPGFSTGALSMFTREGFAPVAALPSGPTLVHRTAHPHAATPAQ